MDLTNSIKLNPVFGMQSKPNKPRWLCNHREAIILEYENMKFKCIKCNPSGGFIKKYQQKTILTTIRENIKRPD